MSLNLVKVEKCPACKNSSGFRELFKFDKFNLYQCSCGVKFIDPSLDEASMISVYQSAEHLKEINPVLEYYYEYETLSADSKTYQDYTRGLDELTRLTPKGSLLEVGCGRGSFLKVAHNQGWNASGIDSSTENIQAVREARIDGICVDFLNFSSPQKYDVIVLWDLIEHPQDPGKFLKKSFELLKSQGFLLIATPNDPSLLSIIASWVYQLSGGKLSGPLKKFYVLEHTSYFNKRTLDSLLNKYNFQTVSFWKTETDIDRYQFSPMTKLFVKISFVFAKILGLENRLILIARKRKQ